MKYILDLDHTLLDTTAFADALAKDGRGDEPVNPRMWYDYSAADYLYSDVVPWLQRIQTADILLLTAYTPALGLEAEAYQRAKVDSSGLAALVSEVVFMEGLKGVVAAEIAKQFPPHEPIVFVDDRVEQCLSVKAALPHALCCVMRRDSETKTTAPTLEGMPVVHTLADVDAIIASL